MITEEEYINAVKLKDQCQDIINQYHQEKINIVQNKIDNNIPFTEDELTYSESTLCPCGHGLAYPKDCGLHHYWDCSAILKQIADKTVEHTDKLPFTFYSIKSEGTGKGTTRGVFKPKE